MEQSVMANDSVTGQSARRGRVILVLVFALFALPLVVAWVMNFVGGWVPHATTNHGELIQPARSVDVQGLVGFDGKPLDPALLDDRWTLVYLHHGECDEPCYNTLYTLRQVRLAQGKNLDRVQRLLLLDEPVAPGWVQEAAGHYPGMHIGRPASSAKAALQPFPASGSIYLIDPLGNLMMQYPLDTEPKGMIKDLERLLKASYVG